MNDVVKDVEVVAVDVQGIMYYVDKYDNVYEMEDVLGNKQNPKIISTLPQQLMYVWMITGVTMMINKYVCTYLFLRKMFSFHTTSRFWKI